MLKLQFFYLSTRSLFSDIKQCFADHYQDFCNLLGFRIERATDAMGRMHSDAQFAGSSSVPAHVEMMGFLGIGNNPMVGCTVACAVDVATALNK